MNGTPQSAPMRAGKTSRKDAPLPLRTSRAVRTARIVGGGIAGMAAAVALAGKGWQVRVQERSAKTTEAGAGLQISPNGARALESLGLLKAVEQRATRPRSAVIRDGATGFEILRLPLAKAAEGRWGAPYLHIHRADFLECLTTGARDLDIALETGAEIAPDALCNYECKGDTLTVIATGAGSVFSGTEPVYTGYAAWRALVPAKRLPENLIAPEATVWIGPGRHMVTYPLSCEWGGDRLVNIVAVTECARWVGEGWSRPGDPEALRSAFAGWHQIATTLLAEVESCVLWGLFDRPAAFILRPQNTALAGDAAHAVLPFMAQGATMALEDAVTLAHCLEDTDIPEALDRYAALRRGRVAQVRGMSRRNAWLFHLRGPLRILAHGPMALASRLTPRIAAARLDWLYGFDATKAVR